MFTVHFNLCTVAVNVCLCEAVDYTDTVEGIQSVTRYVNLIHGFHISQLWTSFYWTPLYTCWSSPKTARNVLIFLPTESSFSSFCSFTSPICEKKTILHIFLKVYSLMSNWGRSQNFQTLNFLHIFVALWEKHTFSKELGWNHFSMK